MQKGDLGDEYVQGIPWILYPHYMSWIQLDIFGPRA